MNISMGAGLVYIAAWNFVEFTRFLQGRARRMSKATRRWRWCCMPCLPWAAPSPSWKPGRQQAWDVAGIPQVKAPLAIVVSAAAVGVLVTQIWLRPLWRHRRQWLARYLQADLVQLRNDLLNLSAEEAERHLDIHHTAYANRAIVEVVAARCHAAGISPAGTRSPGWPRAS